MNDASLRQIEAARPDRSTWLSANAGSGKTRVLTDRVARLLLKGTPPQNILCLTYTKAAASEMQNRLFKRLGAWAMMPDDLLRKTLSDLGESALADPDLAAARRLFALAIETPGGLRIQTIHSFCAVLLRRFPLEAGVSPNFTEMDDRAAAHLRADCLEALAASAPDVIRDAARLSGDTLDSLAAAVASSRDKFAAATEPDLRRALDLPEGLQREDLIAQVFLGGEAALFAALADAMAHGAKTDQGNAHRFLDLAPPWTPGTLDLLEGFFLYKSGAKDGAAKIDAFPTKDARKHLGDACSALNDLMRRVEGARTHRLALNTLDRSLALNRFAAPWLALYQRRKQARGWLDFDDLILGARRLLTDRDVAEWVLYRLDGGIDHILVDEAQDTSPAQWQVIEALAREFAAGHGATSAGERSIFVVGDKKQSIYSFQGADPEGFDRMHDHFSAQLGAEGMARLELRHSFRSSPAILDAVDAVFSGGLGDGVEHLAFHGGLPGRVDLWPVLEDEEEAGNSNWEDPLDRPSPTSATESLARALADTIARMIDGHETIPDAGGGRRRIDAGDILILVRGRTKLFHPIIRACKARGIAIAGADVLALADDLAVRDILSLLRFLALPEDDLSLAEALRSPLLGLSEGELYDLAQGRGRSLLWQRLRESSAHPVAMDIIDDLMAQADFLRPFELIDRLLRRHDGRARLIGRLGPESIDAIDALLAQALEYERLEIPSLTGFLSWFDAGDVTVKRQAEPGGRNLRVMTVHGAKGLEAPIVILPDTVHARAGRVPRFLPVPGGPVLWRPGKADRVPAVAPLLDAATDADKAEHDRLLYVAMTRAKTWLIVCGAGAQNAADKSWHGAVERGLNDLETVALETPAGTGRRFAIGEWAAGPAPETPATRDAARSCTELPDWAHRAPGPAVEPLRLISPSGLGGAKVLSDMIPEPGLEPGSEAEATLRGSRIHLLLEHLPNVASVAWDSVARSLLTADGVAEDDIADITEECRLVLTDADLADLFAKPALTEVALVAEHPSGARIVGAVDRLIVFPDRVLAIDYKSNQAIPENAAATPEGLLRQMGAYSHALQQIYPGRAVETALLWTRGPRLSHLDPALVAAAFARAAS